MVVEGFVVGTNPYSALRSLNEAGDTSFDEARIELAAPETAAVDQGGDACRCDTGKWIEH